MEFPTHYNTVDRILTVLDDTQQVLTPEQVAHLSNLNSYTVRQYLGVLFQADLVQRPKRNHYASPTVEITKTLPRVV